MLLRDRTPIIAQRAGAIVRQPQRHGAVAPMRVNRHLLVVAAQAYDRAGPRRLPPNQQFDHPAALRPAIDVIAEKDVARWPRAGVGLARREQALQLVEAAMNIAYPERQPRGGVRRSAST